MDNADLRKNIFSENFTGDVEFPFFGDKGNDYSTPGGITWSTGRCTAYKKKFCTKENHDMCCYMLDNPDILGTTEENKNKTTILKEISAFVVKYKLHNT